MVFVYSLHLLLRHFPAYIQHQRLMLIHLRPEGASDIFRTGHELTALIIQAENIRIPNSYKSLLLHSRLGTQSTCYIVQIPDLIPLVSSKRNRCITLCIRLCDKGLHLHIPGSHQRPGNTIEVYALIPLVNMERNISAFLFIRTSEPCLYLKGRLKLFR